MLSGVRSERSNSNDCHLQFFSACIRVGRLEETWSTTNLNKPWLGQTGVVTYQAKASHQNLVVVWNLEVPSRQLEHRAQLSWKNSIMSCVVSKWQMLCQYKVLGSNYSRFHYVYRVHLLNRVQYYYKMIQTIF